MWIVCQGKMSWVSLILIAKNQEKIKTFSVPIDFILYCMRPKMNKVVQ